MILITGMPRSGTSYVVNMFGIFGPYMKNPKMGYCPSMRNNEEYKLSEPTLFLGTKDMDNAGVIQLVDKVDDYWKSIFPGYEIVTKHHGLIHNSGVSTRFSDVIVCIRNPESWFESAKRYKPTVAMVKHMTGDDSEESIMKVGVELYERTKKYMNELTIMGIDFHLFDFDQPEEFMLNKWKYFGLTDDGALNEVKSHWKGSRWKKH